MEAGQERAQPEAVLALARRAADLERAARAEQHQGAADLAGLCQWAGPDPREGLAALAAARPGEPDPVAAARYQRAELARRRLAAHLLAAEYQHLLTGL